MTPGPDPASASTPAPQRARHAAHAAPRARQRPSVARLVGRSGFGPSLLSLSVVLALSRLMAHDISAHVLVPLVVAIVVADVVTALSLRLGISVVLAVALGFAVSLLGLLVIVDPSLFNPTSVQFVHSGGFSRQLRAAGTALSHDGTPLPALDGVIVVLGAVGGLAAAFTRGIWSSLRRRHASGPRGPLSPCLAPSLSIFVYSTLVSAEHGRVPAFVSYFLGVLAFVALADHSTSSQPSPLVSTGAARRTGSRSRLVVGALIGSLVVSGVVVAAGAGLRGMRLTVFHVTKPHANAGHTPSNHGSPQSPITGIALVDHLLATELAESKLVVFRAQSPVTTYWQVGTLSSFDGTEWLPTLGVTGALNGTGGPVSLGPAALPTPTLPHSFTAQVAITDFFSRLLPAPPDTLAVHGLIGTAAIGEEGVLAGTASAPGTAYSVTAGLLETVPANGPQLASTDPRLAPYLALPTEPAVVGELAHQAVGSATTPATKAQALVDWFRSGRFRYTLSPPATSGTNPLVQFLTVTKAGYCQQFAGAYGVLARALGIPTRLVVGFTPGQAGANHSFTVTGADAHVWPQVYLGPDAGWVSVEPTPSAAAGEATAEGVLGPSGASQAPTTTAAPRPVPTTTPVTTHPAGSKGSRAHHHGATGVTWWMLLVIGLVALLVIAGLVLWLARRRRSVREAARPPDERVVHAWESALGALEHNGLSRHAQETPGEYASRVQTAEPTLAQPVEADAVAHLAALVELACYTPRSCTPGQVDEAVRLASVIVTTNRSHRRRTVTTERIG